MPPVIKGKEFIVEFLTPQEFEKLNPDEKSPDALGTVNFAIWCDQFRDSNGERLVYGSTVTSPSELKGRILPKEVYENPGNR